MVTISRVVEKIIEDNPFIQEAISRGIINYAALAESIKLRVENEIGEKVKDSAIMMALRRLGEKLDKKLSPKVKFDHGTDIFVKSDLFEITVKKSRKIFGLMREIYETVDPERDFLTITEGLTQVTIISNERNKNKILEILKKERIISEIYNLSSLSTTLPSHAVEGVGYFYVLTRVFAWENIPIIELVSTLNELTLIVKEKDVPKAFTVFKEAIKNNS